MFDKDPRAIQTAQELAKKDARVHVVHDSFKTMSAHLSAQSVDGILLDLGVSSPQIDEAERVWLSSRRAAGHAHGQHTRADSDAVAETVWMRRAGA